MDFAEDPDDLRFRAEVRAFLRQALPDALATRTREVSFLCNNDDVLEWMRILAGKGWLVPFWPVEHGGLGWTPRQQYIFEEECALADAPETNMQCLRMIGPVLYTFGSDEQKARFLPAIRNAEYTWAQGFSEPGAGSDLASLATTAEKVEGGWIVNGQKIWSSGAAEARWAFLLVRTSREARPQAGISFMMTPLDAPGVTVTPIRQYNGDSHFCEMFFDNVFVPDDLLVGEPGKGWSYAKFLLDHERTSSAFIYWAKRQIGRTGELLEAMRGHLAEDVAAAFARRIVALRTLVTAQEWSVLRVIANESSGWHPSAIASSLKITGARLQKGISGLQADIIGVKGLRAIAHGEHAAMREGNDPLWPHDIAGVTSLALIMRAATVYGGSEQIQKNIIARAGLGF